MNWGWVLKGVVGCFLEYGNIRCGFGYWFWCFWESFKPFWASGESSGFESVHRCSCSSPRNANRHGQKLIHQPPGGLTTAAVAACFLLLPGSKECCMSKKQKIPGVLWIHSHNTCHPIWGCDSSWAHVNSSRKREPVKLASHPVRTASAHWHLWAVSS